MRFFSGRLRMNYEEIAEILKSHPQAAVATVVRTAGSAPREPGAKMVVLPDGTTRGTVGGGALEKLVVQDALELLGTGGAALRTYGLRPSEQGGIGAECGGEAEVFIEVRGLADRLLILGGGHIGAALHRLGRELGWETCIVDNRPAFAEASRFPGAGTVLRAEYGDPALRNLVTSRTAAVVVTHAHEGDEEALGNLLHTDAFYIGMIGSRRKVGVIFKRLGEKGVEPGRLDAVRAPVGLDIGAQTPAEIALSILSEIVRDRAGGGSGRPLREIRPAK
jgi:xanthine dehydrogenase accessory factor